MRQHMRTALREISLLHVYVYTLTLALVLFATICNDGIDHAF